ncbi:MAG: hypothetical protein ACLRS8_04465 [Parabacteroides merdae]
MLVHLRDNGNIGGLMADSEIDTILSASKQDYGMFDDLLRKAFHHEPVSFVAQDGQRDDPHRLSTVSPCCSPGHRDSSPA